VPVHSFILNGKRVSADVEDDVRGPKYGCGIGVCQACTSHINGKKFNPCSVPISQIRPTDHITTIEGLPGTVGKDLHPMQEAWLNVDVAQCGYCQPGQIMAAVALVNELHAQGRRTVTDDDLDALRNVCRCGTYPRIREAIREGAAAMVVHQVKPKKKTKAKRKRKRGARTSATA
jgi:isoquinoline 1-oxidoreductase alpha subunit